MTAVTRRTGHATDRDGGHVADGRAGIHRGVPRSSGEGGDSAATTATNPADTVSESGVWVKTSSRVEAVMDFYFQGANNGITCRSYRR